MFRKSAVAAALLLITASTNTSALGLGEIDMQSALNQPMKAAIRLTSAGGTDLSGVKVSIASAEAHQRAGLSRSRILGNFRFKVDQDGSGQPQVLVTSTETIHEPFLEFILELSWANGRLMRQYTVLVDPPLTMPASPAIPATPAASAPAPTASVAAPERQRAARTYTRQPAASTPAATHSAGQAATSYGPVKRSETLWSIASQIRPDRGISIEQMMLALQRANPGAFLNNNINNLKAGVTLQIPSRTEITAISARDARAEFNRQYQEWKGGTTSVADTGAADTAAPAVAPAAASESAAPVMAESRLQLTAPEGEPVAGAAGAVESSQNADTASGGNIEQQLALANEAAEASQAQSEELRSRVSELEEQVATMKRLLELKNEELASIQNQQIAADAEAEPGMEAVEAATEAGAATAPGEPAEAEAQQTEEPASAAPLESAGIVNRLMDNPMLAGLGVLVAMLLGGFLWAATRRKDNQGIFDDEMTLEKRLAAENTAIETQHRQVVAVEEEPQQEETLAAEHDADEGDPLTEADVYLAYGRLQQAEDVLQAALEKSPDDLSLQLKLLEVYHSGGNVAAFDGTAAKLHDSVSADDPVWLKVAAMGSELSPGNELYRDAADSGNNLDFDIDLTGMEDAGEVEEAAAEAVQADIGLDMETRESEEESVPESIDFIIDEFEETDLGYDESEDEAEGLLDVSDEVSTKLDLARAYLDMGDPEGARSILDEVLEEGNEAQKDEAGRLIAEIA